MDRKLSPGSSPFPHRALFCAALLVLPVFAGCGHSQSDKFTNYAQLDGSRKSSGELTTGDNAEVQAHDAETTEAAGAETESGTVAVTASNRVELPAETTEPVTTSGDANLAAPRRADYGIAAKSGEPLPIKLLVPHNELRKEDGVQRATFDDIDLLKILNMQPVPINAVDHFPEWLSSLNGTRIRIRGFMRPTYEAEGLTEFPLVRDNGECCFGPNCAIYDLIYVTLAEGETTDYIQNVPFDVEGTLRIEPYADEIELLALYFIDDARIVK